MVLQNDCGQRIERVCVCLCVCVYSLLECVCVHCMCGQRMECESKIRGTMRKKCTYGITGEP